MSHRTVNDAMTGEPPERGAVGVIDKSVQDHCATKGILFSLA
jgi:hypothetical protein